MTKFAAGPLPAASLVFLLAIPTCSAETTLDLGITGTDFDFREHNPDGSLLDKEEGGLKGLSLGTEVSSDIAFLGFKASGRYNRINYQGYLPQRTLDSTTQTAIVRYQLQGGLRHRLNDQFTVAATAGAGYRRWYRSIHSTAGASGLTEVYHWPFASIGFRGSAQLTQTQQLSLEWQWYEVRGADMDIRFHNGNYDSTTLELPQGNGFSLGASWREQLTETTALQIFGEYQKWHFPRSSAKRLYDNGVASDYTATEPAGKTRELTLGIGLRFVLE